jgi:hypothetical protein
MPRLHTLRLALRGAPLRSPFYTVLSIEFGRPVRLVLRDFTTDPALFNDAPFVVRSLLGGAEQAEGERASPIEHLEIWPDAALEAMEETQAQYGARLTIMPADPHKRTWAEWKAASF